MRFRSTLLGRLYSSHMAVLFLSVLFCGYFAATWLKEIQFNSVSESLRKQSEMVGVILGPRLSGGDKVFIDSFCDRLGSNTPYRLTVLAPDGSILGDSEGSPSKMENHTTRPEIREAMGGVMSSATRYSFTVNKDLVYVALPIIQDGNVIGIVRTSTSIESLGNILNFFYGKLAIAILLLVIVVENVEPVKGIIVQLTQIVLVIIVI